MVKTETVWQESEETRLFHSAHQPEVWLVQFDNVGGERKKAALRSQCVPGVSLLGEIMPNKMPMHLFLQFGLAPLDAIAVEYEEDAT